MRSAIVVAIGSYTKRVIMRHIEFIWSIIYFCQFNFNALKVIQIQKLILINLRLLHL